MDIGYARVSTTPQDLNRQLDQLRAAGIAEAQLYTDATTGKTLDRNGLTNALGYLREGDRLVVASLDRLGRSLPDIYQVIGDLDARGVTLISLKESIDTATSIGRMLAGIFASLAEYEVTLMHERAAAARQARRDRGRPTGRPPKLTAEQKRYARYRKHHEGETASTIASELGVHRTTLYRALNLGSTSATAPHPGQ